MIVLDTNVVSALMLAQPDAVVAAWLDEQPAESIWITSVTTFEVRLGLARLASGRKRRALETAFDQMVRQDLEGRVLQLDEAAAEAAAALAAARMRAGTPVDLRDTLIAGIVAARRATLATRNVRHFSDLGARVVNPWGTGR
ncbi:MAG: type II toxin-antitoxin system VapC family toxin [Acidobacteriota bacterium]